MAVGFDKFEVEKERARLQKLSDAELIREGKSARFMCSQQQISVSRRWMSTSSAFSSAKPNGDGDIQNRRTQRRTPLRAKYYSCHEGFRFRGKGIKPSGRCSSVCQEVPPAGLPSRSGFGTAFARPTTGTLFPQLRKKLRTVRTNSIVSSGPMNCCPPPKQRPAMGPLTGVSDDSLPLCILRCGRTLFLLTAHKC
jgi:hypothetical protein